jgi:uncharacterized protein YacL (UPF0231 family)
MMVIGAFMFGTLFGIGIAGFCFHMERTWRQSKAFDRDLEETKAELAELTRQEEIMVRANERHYEELEKIAKEHEDSQRKIYD